MDIILSLEQRRLRVWLIELFIPIMRSKEPVETVRPNIRNLAVVGHHANDSAKREEIPNVAGTGCSELSNQVPLNFESIWIKKHQRSRSGPINGSDVVFERSVGVIADNLDGMLSVWEV